MTSSARPVAVVTGASSGIGAVFARRLAGRGYDLVLIARREERLQALSDELAAQHGTQSELLVADLTAEAGLKTVEANLAASDRIELLVNNAGLSRIGAFAEVSTDASVLQIALNVVAPTRVTRAVLPGLVQRNKGTIINIASALALHGYTGAAVYSGTKSYLLTWSRALADELAGTGVRVQVALPAAVATELYETAGLPLSALPPEVVMSVDNMVDAVLAGYDRNEPIVLPSAEDDKLWPAYDEARGALFAATQTGTLASRYRA